MEGGEKLKGKDFLKSLLISVFIFSLLISTVYASTPPYQYGGAGQQTEGNANTWPTEIYLSNGTLKMLGIAGASSFVTYGRADSWGYFGIYVTASRNGHIHAYTQVVYNGHVQQYCYVIWMGYAEAHIWILQKIKVYDTSNWQLVQENEKWVYDEGVSWAGSKSKDFNMETYYVSVDFPCVAGHTYAIEVWIECQCAAQAALGGVAQSSYTFAGEYYIRVNYINWYYTS